MKITKSILLTILMFGIYLSSFAQVDTIILKNGDKLEGIVIDISAEQISYSGSRGESQVKVSLVSSILYANGYKESFNQMKQNTNQGVKEQKDIKEIGKKVIYRDKNGAFSETIIVRQKIRSSRSSLDGKIESDSLRNSSKKNNSPFLTN